MWTDDEDFPDSISLAMDTASFIGMAKPSLPEPLPFCEPPDWDLPPDWDWPPDWNWKVDDPAVSTPTTWPLILTRGPPESPGWMSASVSSKSVSRSSEPADSSDAVMSWPTAVTVPVAAEGVPPTPPAFPMATTLWPTETALESPSVAVSSPEAPVSLMTATSDVTL